MASALARRLLRASAPYKTKPHISAPSIKTRRFFRPASTLLHSLRPSPTGRRTDFANAGHHAWLVHSFSTTASRRALETKPVDLAIAIPNFILDFAHAYVGLPWYMAIPAVAVFVRGIVLYYYFALPTRRRQILSNNLSPLVAVRVESATNEFVREALAGKSIQDRAAKVSVMRVWVAFKRYSLSFRIHGLLARKFGQTSVAQSAITRFAVEGGTWLAFIEALRLKCGTGEGLLAFLLRPLTAALESLQTTDGAAIAERIEAATQLGQGSSAALQTPAATRLATYVDPSLKLEGFSWLQDLTMPDNTFVLPAIFAGVIVAQFYIRPVIGKQAFGTDDSAEIPDRRELPTAGDKKFQQALARADQVRASTKPKLQTRTSTVFQILVNGWFLLAFFNLPAAVSLYILTNRIVSWLQRRWLDISLPPPTPIRPCRRPMRVRAKLEAHSTW